MRLEDLDRQLRIVISDAVDSGKSPETILRMVASNLDRKASLEKPELSDWSCRIDDLLEGK